MNEVTPDGDAPVAARMDVGDVVPPYAPDWLRGRPMPWFAPGALYLIECWASWCGPCRAPIPHVDALHRRYHGRGLVVIGQNVWEDDREAVTSFMDAQGDDMSYPVALDDGTFARDWLGPAGVEGIPHAFVVRDGRLLWKGHPGELDDSTLERMLDGSFDAAAAAQAAARKRALRTRAQDEMEAGDWAGARRTLDDIAREQGEGGVAFAQSFRLAVLLGCGQVDAAADAMRAAIARDGDEAVGVAWTVATFRVGLESPVVMALAVAATETGLAGDRTPGMLALAAEVQWLAGRRREPVALVREALDGAARDDQVPAYLRKLLAALQEGRLPDRRELNAWAAEGYVPREA